MGGGQAYGGYHAAGGAVGVNPAAVGAAAGQQGQGQKPQVVAAASVWTEHKTDDGITYWYNCSTGVSQVAGLSTENFASLYAFIFYSE